MSWNENLENGSPAYQFAVDKSKSIRVVAGPGTGKSFGLRKRVARLLEEGAIPQRILAVTFTRTAALDLKTEMSSVGVDGADDVVAKTLHSFCFYLLNKKSIIESTGRFPRPMLSHELKPMLHDIGDQYGGLREKEKTLRAFEAIWARLQSDTPAHQVDAQDRLFEASVTNWLVEHKSMLFGEMIRETYKYLRSNPQCDERTMFDHVLVDEYQDLNKAEQVVIDYLASNANLVVIGDDDQSIYSFKHAHPEGIREFPQVHNPCTSIDFDHCRRCPTTVVKMASKLISNNTNRTLGDLKPYTENSDGLVKIVQFKDLGREISGICKFIEKHTKENDILPQDVLVLVPVRKIGYRVRNCLDSLGVRAKSYFRESALVTELSRHVFSMINLIAIPDDMVALRYLLGEGSQDYRKKSYMKILEHSRSERITIQEVFNLIINGEHKIPYTKPLADKYKEIKDEFNRLNEALSLNRKEIFNLIREDDEDNSDLRNVILSAVNEIGFMEEVSVSEWMRAVYSLIVENVSFPQGDSEQDHVRIMSLHASKGLSAKLVVVMSCIDELLPRMQLDATPEEIRSQLEEQRRLFYVAITRCKSAPPNYPGTLVISSFVGLPGKEALQINIPANSTQWRKVRASRFISEFEETAPETIIVE